MLAIRSLLALAFLIFVAAPASGQPAPVKIRVLESDPGFTGSLGMGKTLYIRLGYKSARPVRFQAEGRAAGQKVTAGASFNIAPPYPAGEGEALVWIAFRQAPAIDEIRINAFDERWQPLASISVPARLEWGGPAQARPRPAWVDRLNRAQQESVREQAEKTSENYGGFGGLLFGILIIGLGWISVIGYLVLQVLLPRRYVGGWRIAALVPLLATIPLFGHAIYALNAGSNLWPLGLIFLMPVAFLYFLLLLVVRWAWTRRA